MNDHEIADRCGQIADALEAGGGSPQLRDVADGAYLSVTRAWNDLATVSVTDTVKRDDGTECPRTMWSPRRDHTPEESMRLSVLWAAMMALKSAADGGPTPDVVGRLRPAVRLLAPDRTPDALRPPHPDVHVHVAPPDLSPITDALKAAALPAPVPPEAKTPKLNGTQAEIVEAIRTSKRPLASAEDIARAVGATCNSTFRQGAQQPLGSNRGTVAIERRASGRLA